MEVRRRIVSMTFVARSRTKYVKSLVAGALGEDEALALKEEAGTIHRMITGSAVEEDTASESYDLLVAYFYR